MNGKDLEALVIRQGEYLQAANQRIAEAAEAHMHLVQRADNIVEGFKLELAARDKRLEELTAHDQGQGTLILAVQEVTHELNLTVLELITRLERVETMVLARNSSAPTKRNMTDEDALKVLTGDLKGLAHKEAAEKAGLTYAQVYSCRLEFTFKHVHKTLRDGSKPEAPWVNPWAK